MEQEDWKNTPERQSEGFLLHNVFFSFTSLGKIYDNTARKENW